MGRIFLAIAIALSVAACSVKPYREDIKALSSGAGGAHSALKKAIAAEEAREAAAQRSRFIATLYSGEADFPEALKHSACSSSDLSSSAVLEIMKFGAKEPEDAAPDELEKLAAARAKEIKTLFDAHRVQVARACATPRPAARTADEDVAAKADRKVIASTIQLHRKAIREQFETIEPTCVVSRADGDGRLVVRKRVGGSCSGDVIDNLQPASSNVLAASDALAGYLNSLNKLAESDSPGKVSEAIKTVCSSVTSLASYAGVAFGAAVGPSVCALVGDVVLVSLERRKLDAVRASLKDVEAAVAIVSRAAARATRQAQVRALAHAVDDLHVGCVADASRAFVGGKRTVRYRAPASCAKTSDPLKAIETHFLAYEAQLEIVRKLTRHDLGKYYDDLPKAVSALRKKFDRDISVDDLKDVIVTLKKLGTSAQAVVEAFGKVKS